MLSRTPLNLSKWIDEHRAVLKPPVANKLVFENADTIVMMVGGNTRRDYHVNEGEEFFHQIEGNIVLKIIADGQPVDIPIQAGEVYLLPANVPHSPRRPSGSIGLVIEHKRRTGERDGFQWYCETCGGKLHEEFLELTNIVTQLPPLFATFYGDESKRLCRCGSRFPDPV